MSAHDDDGSETIDWGEFASLWLHLKRRLMRGTRVQTLRRVSTTMEHGSFFSCEQVTVEYMVGGVGGGHHIHMHMHIVWRLERLERFERLET